MLDFDGNELNVGDKVITTIQNSRAGSFAGFAKATVIGFTPKMVKLEFYSKPGWNNPYSKKTTNKDPYTVAKFEWKENDE